MDAFQSKRYNYIISNTVGNHRSIVAIETLKFYIIRYEILFYQMSDKQDNILFQQQ